MIPLSAASSSGITWSKIARSRKYELRRNGEVLGTLLRPSVWSSNYLAETRDGRWTFRRSGLLCNGAQILDSASGQHIATFKSDWGLRGNLTFTDGDVYRLECKGWWRPVWAIMTHTGQLVLCLRTREKTVETAPAATIIESRLHLLAMFTLYRRLQAEEDAAAATVAVFAAS